MNCFGIAVPGFFILITFLVSCQTPNKTPVEPEDIQISTSFRRFDQELFSLPKPVTQAGVISLRNRYTGFFDLFCNRIIHIPAENDSMIAANLDLFTSDPDVTSIYRKTQEVFAHTAGLEKELINMLKLYHYYFPSKPVPEIIAYVSAFNYTVITTDSALGIGLDMYLGKDCEFYPALGLPRYMTEKLTAEYLVRDAVKALFQSDYDPDQVSNEFLSQVIYQGKLLYLTDLLIPGADDSLKSGYSSLQTEWCRKNEANIWGFMIENNLLYSHEPSRYIRYINDGTGTQGLPKEAPARLGAWIGWQIIRAYAAKHPDFLLEKLLNEQDAQKILAESGYKPGKS